jgi:hypothetical protein
MSPPVPLGQSPFEQALNHATGILDRLVSLPPRDAFDVAVFVTLVSVVIATGFVQNGLSTAVIPVAAFGENAGGVLQATVG